MTMPGRKYTAPSSTYRYGFNGKENDKDAGEGIQDYGMRIYSERLGRFLSVDPITAEYPELTPYQFASNTPIQATDLDGLEADFSAGKILKRQEYRTYDKLGVAGNFLMNLGFDGKGNTVGNNLSTAVQNQLIGTAETITNLTTEKGRAKVGHGVAETTYFWIWTWNSKTPDEQFKMAKGYFSEPENLENLAAAGFLFGVSRYLPALRVPVPKTSIPISIKNTLTAIVPPYMSGRFIIGSKTFAKVARHLRQFGDRAENVVMLDRMKRIARGKLKPTEIDINFARHELREAELMKKGLKYEDAHTQTLKEQGMYHKDYEKKLYTEEALKKGNEQMIKETTGNR
jgi:RHS repeat-associated protein